MVLHEFPHILIVYCIFPIIQIQLFDRIFTAYVKKY